MKMSITRLTRIENNVKEIRKEKEYKILQEQLQPIYRLAKSGKLYVDNETSLQEYHILSHIDGINWHYSYLHNGDWSVNMPIITATSGRSNLVYIFVTDSVEEVPMYFEELRPQNDPKPLKLWEISDWAAEQNIIGTMVVLGWRKLMNDTFIRTLLNNHIPNGKRLSVQSLREALY